MKYSSFLVAIICMWLASSCADSPAVTPSTDNSRPSDTIKRSIRVFDAEALTLIDTAASIDIIAEGFNWTEGPLYIANGDYFIFSDIPQNCIYRWKEGKGTDTFLTPSGYTGIYRRERTPGSNGLLLDHDGLLVLMQQGDRRIAKMINPLTDPAPKYITMVDKFEGKPLNSPNDAVYHPNGDLYFTDPPYGLDKGMDDTAKKLDFSGVYRLKQPSGDLDVLTKTLNYPNGIALSPDARFLYVANSDPGNMIWMKYTLDSKGLLQRSDTFYTAHEYEHKELGAPDGMKINAAGYLFATGPEGVWIFNPAGKLIARLYTGQLTSNCALSSDEKTLYMTCNHYIMRLKLR